jgi:CRP/FNR family cyclic AMP-dependent transcriptional regulator
MRKVLFILSELADGDIDWMIQNGTKTSVPQGAVLIEEGRSLDVLYVVLDGQLAVSLAALDGKPIALLQSGEILGELSFLDSRPPSASVTALEPSTVLSIPRARLTEKLEADSGFAARFYRALGVFLASRLRRSQQRLGYDNDRILDEDVEHEDELDPDLLENLALAGARFDWMLKRLREAPTDGSPGGH